MKRTAHFSTSSLLVHLGYLFGLFLIMLITCSFVTYFIPYLNLSPRTEGLSVATAQSLLIFIVPSLAYTHLFYGAPIKSLTLNRLPLWKPILGVVLIFLIGLPFLNQIIFWNESIAFPESMREVEKIFRDLEDNALAATKVLLSTTSIGGLISGILIIGLLTGIAEELFFRGCMQRAFIRSGVGPHISIWIVALIFSGMHFQLYGFIPRLLLGALFGYLFWWTASIWISIIAHTLNNVIVVISFWCQNRHIIHSDIEGFGVSSDSFPWIFVISGIALMLFLFFGRKFFFSKNDAIRK